MTEILNIPVYAESYENLTHSEPVDTARIAQVTIVVPTRNERDNVQPLLSTLEETMRGIDTTIIFVDDSDDDTAARIVNESLLFTSETFRPQLIERVGTDRIGGLSGAVLAGIEAAKTQWVCVMDGDLQHPPSALLEMLDRASEADTSIVIASRYAADGSNAGLIRRGRKLASTIAGQLAKSVFAAQLRNVTDPMSGFFVVDKTRLDVRLIRPRGFKILLEILVSHPDLNPCEVAFTFGGRGSGESKASSRQGFEFVRQLGQLKANGSSRLMWRYNIHDIVAVESDKALPELEKFLVRSVGGLPTISVRVATLHHVPLGESLDLTGDVPVVSYRERTGFGMSLTLGINTTDVVVTSFVAKSPHVMYTNVVEPILRWRLVESGFALVHAACFADGDDAYLITALTDTGKTTTMLKVLDQSDLKFVSDDLIVLAADGAVRTFPKPLTISAHTVHALHNTMLNKRQRIALIPQSRIHSREGRRLAFLLTKYQLPVASINAIIQRLVPPPKYHVERLVRGVKTANIATARGMFIIQRGGCGEEVMNSADSLRTLLANCDDAFGFPPYSSLERLLLAASDDDLRSKEREIIAAALSDRPVVAMKSDSLDWAERIPAAVRSWRSVRAQTETLTSSAEQG
ncbi:MAG: glycosyltransferase [Ilumatobacteraceae bacterium]|nr:glycosyltransferase [Ilumatobacteraceae bacterium]